MICSTSSKLPLKVFAALAVLSLSFSSFAKTALAQEAVGFAISPPTFELSANPGDRLENSIKVENPSDKPINIVVDVRNFAAVGEGGAVGLTEEETTYSLAKWITVDPTEDFVDARSQKTFKFTIDVPLNAEPGGHFGSVVFTIRAAPSAQGGAAVSQEIGALVLLRVAGDAEESAVIESFTASKSFYEYGPVEFEIRTKNEGNVHLRPRGQVVISDLFGRTVATVEIEPKNVLPGAVRRTNALWDVRYMFGKYNATATLSYGSSNETITATTTFGGFPYKMGLVALGVLLLVILVLFKGRHRIGRAVKVLSGRES